MNKFDHPATTPLAGGYTPLTRRSLLTRALGAAGSTALTALLAEEGLAAPPGNGLPAGPALTLPRKAKRMIVLWQGGAPSHVDLFDHKPHLATMRGTELPESVRSKVR
ncbi:MAG: DUF1501 domain-containing protein, partial [Armatimonadota bacterium]